MLNSLLKSYTTVIAPCFEKLNNGDLANFAETVCVMWNCRLLLSIGVLLVLSNLAFAQNGLNGTYTCVVMQEKNYLGGVGLKVGAPIGLTYKMYFLKRFAFEVAGGFSNTSTSEDYIKDKFNQALKAHFDDPDKFAAYDYSIHSLEGSYAGQVRLMMHLPIPRGLSGRGFENLDWYVGIGAEIRVIDIKYLYKYQKGTHSEDIESFRHRLVELGPEWMLGFEYAFKDIPLSAFAEMGMFIRINEKTPFSAVQGGLGVRLNF